MIFPVLLQKIWSEILYASENMLGICKKKYYMHFAYNCSTCNKCYQIQSYEYKFFKKQFRKNYLFHLEFLFNFNEFSFWNNSGNQNPGKV